MAILLEHSNLRASLWRRAIASAGLPLVIRSILNVKRAARRPINPSLYTLFLYNLYIIYTYFIFLNIALPGQTHCWLFGQTVTGGHFQVSLWHKGVGIVCQLVARQRRRRAIGVRMVHHGTVVVVPIGVYWGQLSIMNDWIGLNERN